MSGYEQIVCSHHHPAFLQVRTNLCIMRGRLVGEIQNLDIAKKCGKRRFVAKFAWRDFNSKQEFRFRYDGDAYVTNGNFLQAF